jgi:hypothetical protein
MDNNGHVVIVWSGNGPNGINSIDVQQFNIKGGSGMTPMVTGSSAPEVDNDFAADPSLNGNNPNQSATSVVPGAATGTNAGVLDILVRLANGALVHPNGCRCPQCLAALAVQPQGNTSILQPALASGEEPTEGLTSQMNLGHVANPEDGLSSGSFWVTQAVNDLLAAEASGRAAQWAALEQLVSAPTTSHQSDPLSAVDITASTQPDFLADSDMRSWREVCDTWFAELDEKADT